MKKNIILIAAILLSGVMGLSQGKMDKMKDKSNGAQSEMKDKAQETKKEVKENLLKFLRKEKRRKK